MKYKILALDLDGTVLLNDRSVSPKVLKAVDDAKAAGIRVILASGRAKQSIDHYINIFKPKDCTIALAGGETYDANGNMVTAEYLPPELAVKVMNWADERGLHYQAYLPGVGLSYAKRCKYTDYYEKNCQIKGTVAPGLKDMADIKTAKVLIAGEQDLLAKIRPELERAVPESKILTSEPLYLEVLNPFTSKANALKKIAESSGIPREQIMAIGDSEIDADMLEYAGFGVCMANGADATLKSADYITASNEEDGAADAIYRFALTN